MADPMIIDVHMHVYPTAQDGIETKALSLSPEYGDINAHHPLSRFDGDLASAQQAIDEAGLARAVVLNGPGRTAVIRNERIAGLSGDLSEAQRQQALRDIDADVRERLADATALVCEIAKEYPKMVPCVCIDPQAFGADGAAAHLRDMVENHGARGMKLHPPIQRFYVNDERMWPTYRTCQELDLIVISHSGPSVGTDQHGEPRAYADTLAAFPELKMVMAHMGGGAWRQVRDLAEARPNAMFDCCEIIDWKGAPNAPTDRELAQLIKDVGPERVMLGSDFPWWDPAHCVERLMELPLLSAEEKERELGANAVRLLGL